MPGATLRYPSWGRIRTRVNEARSIYHGMTASMNKRYSNNWQAQVSYTLGNSHDTWSGGQIGGSDFDNGAGSASDWWDPEYEYGPSSFDIRHTFIANAVYVIPYAQGATGVKHALLANWQVGGVAQFSSGLPFTPFESYDQVGDGQADTGLQKPDVNGTVSYPGTAEMWFDPSVFSVPAARVFGNAKRNSLRGPGLKVADLSLFKNQKFGRMSAQFRLGGVQRLQLGEPRTARYDHLQRRRRAQRDRRTHHADLDAGTPGAGRHQTDVLNPAMGNVLQMTAICRMLLTLSPAFPDNQTNAPELRSWKPRLRSHRPRIKKQISEGRLAAGHSCPPSATWRASSRPAASPCAKPTVPSRNSACSGSGAAPKAARSSSSSITNRYGARSRSCSGSATPPTTR